jgi:molybdopterin molybdotransferase
MEQYRNEIDEGTGYLGYAEAFASVVDAVPRLEPEELSLDMGVGRIAAEDVVARISYPSQDVSLKDGYAVISGDIAAASPENKIGLEVIGAAFAGAAFKGEIRTGQAVKICSGAPIPLGVEAVLSEEFCEELSPGRIAVSADAGPGRNILRAGAEVKTGATIVERGGLLLPGYLGLAAAAGTHTVSVYRRPRAAVIGVGDEVVAPGENLSPGQLYASNLVTMEAWLASFSISCASSVVPDDAAAIQRELARCIGEADVLLTSGGAWGSERDLVVGALGDLGWEPVFYHVRMGPGKGIAFGRWRDKPVFCLPGGPASNEMAFLQLALPGILRMSGDTRHPLQTVPARLTEDVAARHRAWTEFKDATLARDESGDYTVSLYRHRSRLQAIASAHGLVCVPEGTDGLPAGQVVPVQVLSPRLDDL